MYVYKIKLQPNYKKKIETKMMDFKCCLIANL